MPMLLDQEPLLESHSSVWQARETVSFVFLLSFLNKINSYSRKGEWQRLGRMGSAQGWGAPWAVGAEAQSPNQLMGFELGSTGLGLRSRKGSAARPVALPGPKRRFSMKSSPFEEGLALPGLGWGKGRGLGWSSWLLP